MTNLETWDALQKNSKGYLEEITKLKEKISEARQEAESWRRISCGLLSEIEDLKTKLEELEK